MGILAFWHMAMLETLWATIRSMNPTAGQSMLRDLVPESELMSAVSLYSIGFNFARIARFDGDGRFRCRVRRALGLRSRLSLR